MTGPPRVPRGKRDPHRPSAVILLYHRVTRLRSDPHATAVNPDRFAAHLEVIAASWRALSLTELLRGLETGRIPDRAVCLTFDDGYRDNLDEGEPLLARAGIPATVFVTSGVLHTGREFWWDQLERLFLTPGTLPDRLSMRLGRRRFRTTLGSAATYDEQAAREHAGWSVRSEAAPTRRHAVFLRLMRRLKRLDGEARGRALEDLHEWAESDADYFRETHRPLDADALAVLAGRDAITIGAHTVSHPRLSKLPRRKRWAEIAQSRTSLEEITGAPVTHFAYPFGDTARAVTAVRDAGMTAGLMTRPAAVSLGADPYLLPRLYVGDWPAEDLETMVEAHLSPASAGVSPDASGTGPDIASAGAYEYVAETLGPRLLVVAPSGRALFVANWASNEVASFQIDPGTGSLTAAVRSPFHAGSNPRAVTLHPSGRFLYASNWEDHTLSAFRVHEDGGLDPVPGSPFATERYPRNIRFDVGGRFGYVSNSGSATISSYRVDIETGVLTPTPGSPVTTEARPRSAMLGPRGRFLFAAHEGTSIITSFCIDQKTGDLAASPGSPISSGRDPRFVTVDPGGRFAYTANQRSNDISGYTIDEETGALRAVPGSPFRARRRPFQVLIDVAGRFVFVANQGSRSLSAWVIDRDSGALAPVPGVSFRTGRGPIWPTVDPTGKWVYVANRKSDDISGFAIGRDGGSLSPLPGSPWKTGTGPRAVTIDGTGRHLYVANAGSGTISGFEIDPSTGALSPVPGSPVPSGWISDPK